MTFGSETPDELVRAVEATLFASEAPMSAEAISLHLGGAAVKGALADLAAQYEGRGVRLVGLHVTLLDPQLERQLLLPWE